MCGIAGVAGPEAEQRAVVMGAALAHRGPDDEGLYADPSGAFALAARRLSIIDVPGGHQPIANEDGTVWAALNGEIYNFRTLRERLEARGHRFATRCDTEVLVHLYEEHGAGLVDQIEGMFAFAVWDERRGRLLLGRDRCGEKPLFVHADSDGLVFASELGALLGALPGGAAALDPALVDAFFVLGYVPPSRAVVADVEQLAPGTTLEWSRGAEPVIRRYWAPGSPPDGAAAPETRVARAGPALVSEFDELLGEAVRSRMISDVPLGLFLSGGLDSTLIAAIAREQGEVRSFSVGYDVGSVSETARAASVARHLGLPHEELVLRSADVEELALDVLANIDQPLADQALLPMHALSRHAVRGVKVIVGGEGADEFFAGYPRYRWLQRAARLRTSGARLPLALLARRWPVARDRERLALVAEVLSDSERNLRWVGAGRSELRTTLYGERLRSCAAGDGIAAAQLRLDGVRGAAREAMARDQRVWLPGDVLTKADRAGMLCSLEVRAPFLHRGLVERACAVPYEVHARGGGKALLRAALKRRAPELDAPRKRAFEVPAAEWLRGPLRAQLEHCVHDSRLVADGWFDGPAIATQARAHLAGEDRADVLWPLLALGTWLEGPHGSHVG